MFTVPAAGTPFDGAPTAALLASLLLAALALLGVMRFAWLLLGARRRRFAVVLNGEVISTHRTEKHANKAFAEAIGQARVREQGESAGLLWALVDGQTPGQRYAVIDRGQHDRRKRRRPRDAAHKAVLSALRIARLSRRDPYGRRSDD